MANYLTHFCQCGIINIYILHINWQRGHRYSQQFVKWGGGGGAGEEAFGENTDLCESAALHSLLLPLPWSLVISRKSLENLKITHDTVDKNLNSSKLLFLFKKSVGTETGTEMHSYFSDQLKQPPGAQTPGNALVWSKGNARWIRSCSPKLSCEKYHADFSAKKHFIFNVERHASFLEIQN